MDEFEIDNPTFDEDDGQAGVVGRQDDDSDGAGDGAEDGGAAARREPDHQLNAAMKAARLQGASEAEKRLRKQFDEEISGMGVPNPYTGKPFKSYEEFRDYGRHYRAEQLNVPVEQLEQDDEDKRFIRSLRAENEKKAESEKKEREKREWLQNDVTVFVSKYPDIDPAKLEANAKFKKFAGSRLYNEPLAELYEAYKDFTSDTEAAAIARKASRDERSTGAGGTSSGTVLTAAEQKALDEWNARFPGEKMTAAEFKKR